MKRSLYEIGYGLYCCIAIITSAPFFLKHFDNQFIFIPIYAFLLIFLIFLIHRLDVRRFAILNHHLPWIGLVAILAVANTILYPQTRIVPGTAPDALVQPAIALFLNGANPYAVRLFDGAPISPGPGWILMNAIFLLSGSITLLTPIYLLWVGWMIAKWEKANAFLFVMFLYASLNFLQLSFTGHDLAAISLAMVALTLMLFRARQGYFYIIIAILTGVVATARVPFIIFPLALSLCLFPIDRKRAIQFGTISIGTALVIHLVFYLWALSDGLFYQPLHVFTRATQGSSLIFLGIGALTWLMAGLYMWRRLTDEPSSWMYFLWTVIAIPYIFVGFGELLPDGILVPNSWANWEGKGYVMFALPILLAGLVLHSKSRQ